MQAAKVNRCQVRGARLAQTSLIFNQGMPSALPFGSLIASLRRSTQTSVALGGMLPAGSMQLRALAAPADGVLQELRNAENIPAVKAVTARLQEGVCSPPTKADSSHHSFSKQQLQQQENIQNYVHSKQWPVVSQLPRSAIQTGRVELIVGPMFAGKTTELMSRCRKAKEEGKSVLVIKSAKDQRYAVSAIATHDGDEMPCHATASLMTVPEDLGPLFNESQVIAIDEGQFFGDLLDFVHVAADKLHKTVLIAALDGDFKRQKFGQVLDVLPMADIVHKLHARCFSPGCNRHAVFSMRTTAHAQQELVGGASMYVAACRYHYLQPHN